MLRAVIAQKGDKVYGLPLGSSTLAFVSDGKKIRFPEAIGRSKYDTMVPLGSVGEQNGVLHHSVTGTLTNIRVPPSQYVSYEPSSHPYTSPIGSGALWYVPRFIHFPVGHTYGGWRNRPDYVTNPSMDMSVQYFGSDVSPGFGLPSPYSWSGNMIRNEEFLPAAGSLAYHNGDDGEIVVVVQRFDCARGGSPFTLTHQLMVGVFHPDGTGYSVYKSTKLPSATATLPAPLFGHAARVIAEAGVTYTRKPLQSFTPIITDANDLIRDFDSHIDRSYFPTIDPNLKHDSDLVVDAVDSLNDSGTNSLEFLFELRNPKSLITAITDLGKIRGARTAASGFLGTKYGTMNTYSDLKAFYDVFNSRTGDFRGRDGAKRLSSSSTSSKVLGLNQFGHSKRSYHLGYMPYDNVLSNLIGKLESYGARPTFERLWNVLPYSFIVDWFFDVSSVLKSMDTSIALSTLDVVWSITTDSVETVYPLLYDIRAQDVTFKVYQRRVSPNPPTPNYFGQLGKVRAHKHLLEGSALIAQRSKLK